MPDYSPGGRLTSALVDDALATVSRLRGTLNGSTDIPADLADALTAGLATIEAALTRVAADEADGLPMHAHQPERMLRGE